MRKRRENPEDALQSRIVGLLTVAAIPKVFWFSVPNGARTAIREAVRLKATGMKPGVGDLVIVAECGKVFFMEVKFGNRPLSAAQCEFRDLCRAMGVPWAVVRSLDEAQDALTSWSLLRVVKAQ